MQAVAQTKYGSPDVLKIRDFMRPVPLNNQVLMKVHASTVTRGDAILRKLHPLLFLPIRLFGVTQKETPGHEFAGEILETGKDIKKFKLGDKVFGITTGLPVGAHTGSFCLPEKWQRGVITRMLANTTLEAAAALPVGGMPSLKNLKKARIKPNQKVLVYGASGSLGTYAFQLASHYYGAEVTGVCSTNNVELVKDLGAASIIDYTETDITQIDQTYNVVFDAVGKMSRADAKRMLNKNGIYLSVRSMSKESEESLLLLANLLSTEKIKAVIDSRYALTQMVEQINVLKQAIKLEIL